jgi:hypothetical protein
MPLTKEANDEGHARTPYSDRKSSFDPSHIGEQNSGEFVSVKDIFKLRGASGEKKSRTDGGGTRSRLDNEAVGEGSLCGGDTKRTTEELKD